MLRLFDTAFEANVSTWLSSAVWLAATGCACMVGAAGHRLGDADGARWLVLGGCFLLLAIDETAQAHELLVGPAIDLAEAATGLAHGPARLAAAAGAGAALLGLAAWLWPWLQRLPHDLRSRLLVAGALFVGGALGLEVASRLVETRYLSPFEELGEMLGVAVLLTALLPYVRAVVARLPAGAAPPTGYRQGRLRRSSAG